MRQAAIALIQRTALAIRFYFLLHYSWRLAWIKAKR